MSLKIRAGLPGAGGLYQQSLMPQDDTAGNDMRQTHRRLDASGNEHHGGRLLSPMRYCFPYVGSGITSITPTNCAFRECQKKDWPEHKTFCDKSSRPLILALRKLFPRCNLSLPLCAKFGIDWRNRTFCCGVFGAAELARSITCTTSLKTKFETWTQQGALTFLSISPSTSISVPPEATLELMDGVPSIDGLRVVCEELGDDQAPQDDQSWNNRFERDIEMKAYYVRLSLGNPEMPKRDETVWCAPHPRLRDRTSLESNKGAHKGYETESLWIVRADRSALDGTRSGRGSLRLSLFSEATSKHNKLKWDPHADKKKEFPAASTRPSL
ncbi:hypothetical protein C8R45DRAFT_928382 [Mycena sanguinolenta]|nr:hypothetical protein C8R45DRAFT_928382 [Mycena sanguinolenta]